MARSSKEASEFLRTLSDRVTPLAEKELAKLKQYKEAEVGAPTCISCFFLFKTFAAIDMMMPRSIREPMH